MKKAILMTVVLMFVLSGVGMAREPGPARAPHVKAHYVKARHVKDSMELPPVKWWKMPLTAEKLSLTKEETEKLDAMYYAQRMRLIDLRSQMAKDRLEMEQLFEKEPFDAAACLNSFKKSQDARNAIGLERFKFLIQVRELLGGERFQMLKEEFKRFREKKKIGKFRTPRGERPRT